MRSMLMVVRACLLIIAVLGATGCTKRQAAAGAGLGMTLAGVAVMATEYADDEDQQLESTSFGPPLLAVGLITLFVSAALDESQDEPGPIVIGRYEPRPSVAAENRRTAGELTKAAKVAARRSDCERVALLDAQVRHLDPDLHAVVFARDVAIQRCFAAAAAAPPAPPAPPATEAAPSPASAVEPGAPATTSPPTAVEPSAPATTSPPPPPETPIGPSPAPAPELPSGAQIGP